MLLHLLAPSECVGCGGALGNGLCDACAANARDVEEQIVGGVRILSAGVYEGALGQAVRAFKYQERTELQQPLARLLGHLLEPFGSDVLLLPVPMHRQRLAERGYNQSALLAGALGKHHGIKVDYRLLQRVQQTAQQAGLNAQARRLNVEDSFAIRERRRSRPAAVVLVDDVVTTGATLLGCVAALERAGYEVRGGVAVARAKG